MAWKRLSKPRFLFVYPLLPLVFLGARVTDASFRAGLIVILLGIFLRLWANGYVGLVKVNRARGRQGDTKVGQLVTAGPYAFVRHPLYLGTLLIGAGFLIAVSQPWLALVAAVAFALAYRPKIREEDRVLLRECGVVFKRYRRAVPALLPTWRRYASRHGTGSWSGVRISREATTVTWVAVVTLLVYCWKEGVGEGQHLFAEHVALRVSLIVVVLAFVVWDVRAWYHRRRAKGRLARAAARG